MGIKEILNDIMAEKLVHSPIENYQQLTGGTTSQLFLIELRDLTKLVFKVNDTETLESEALYLNFYRGNSILTPACLC